jgi:hypothetical protein
MDNRSKVFICYSHKDEKFLRELSPHLELLAKNNQTDIWSDRKIEPGSKWQDEIKNAIEAARVAILLVSVDFLTSQFITEYELPALLRAARLQHVRILPVSVRPTDGLGELRQFKFVNDLSKPLSIMKKAEREEVWAITAKMVSEAFKDKELVSGNAVKAKLIEHISKFSGSTLGVVNHGLGVKPDEIIFQVSSGRQRVWYENVTATQVLVLMESVSAFTGYAIKYF